MHVSAQIQDSLSIAQQAVIRKVWRRIIYFSAALLLFAQIDKFNISFAALTMSRDLGLTATVFGMAASIFYVSYAICEIPSNLIMARVGGRTWLARISITLGLCSAATLFSVGANSLLSFRFLLGVFEAGMTPGLLLYLTFWFPSAYRARANAWFLTAMPIAGIVGSVMAGAILHLDGLFGLAGWRWLFLLMGAPPVILGVIAFFYLTDGPEKARWLSSEEKQQLLSLLRPDEPAGKPISRKLTLGQLSKAMMTPAVMFLTIANSGVFIVLAVLTIWTPQIVKAVLPQTEFWLIGVISALPPLAATVCLPIWATRSDARRERKWHVIVPMVFAACGLAIAAYAPVPPLKLLGLIMCSAGMYGGYGVFWALVGVILPEVQRPAGIALIHVGGTVGAIVSPLAVGYLRDLTGNFSASLLFAVAVGLVSASLISLVSPPRTNLTY